MNLRKSLMNQVQMNLKRRKLQRKRESSSMKIVLMILQLMNLQADDSDDASDSSG